MKQERTLNSYSPYPINDIIQKRLKLTALILSRPDLYFLPEAILAGSDIRTSLENEGLALSNRQPSIDGNYELTDILSIVNGLESLSGSSPLNRRLAVAGLKSPDGVAGCLIIIEKWERPGYTRNRPQLASIPLARILIKPIHSMDQVDECQIGTPEHDDQGTTKKAKSEEVDPRSEKSYLRLIGVLARKLEDLAILDSDSPGKAASQVVDMAGTMKFANIDVPIGVRQKQAIQSKLQLAIEVLSNPALTVPECKKRIRK